MKKPLKNNLPAKFMAMIVLLIFSQAASPQKGLTLNDALSVAESNSPSLKRSQLGLIRSQENLNAQRAALKSAFSLNITPFSYTQGRTLNEQFATYSTSRNMTSSASFNVVQPIIATDATLSLVNRFKFSDVYTKRDDPYYEKSTNAFDNNLTLSLDQPIFTYNRTKLQLKELEFNLENTQISHVLSRLQLERQVTQSFYTVYQQQQSLDISMSAYKNMQESYEITRAKAQAGLAADVELYQAELNLANSRSDYENRLVSLENAKDDFKLLVGMSLFDDFVAVPDITVDTISIDIGFAIEQGLRNRLELRQRQISIETSQFDMIRTMALNEFKGSVGLSVGLAGDNENLLQVYNQPNSNQSVQLNLTIPLWDWGEKKSRIKASEASIETQEIAFEDEENSITLSIRKVYRNLLNLRNQIEIARQSTVNAELTYQINLERYRNGDLTGMDLNRFQEQLSQSQISFTNALISYKLELLNLKVQTLYDFEKNEPLSPLSVFKQN
ncbi:MAG: TolC family protein [Bacteroidetes bacterium]|nr:TolC family protein [Bacteroidota bacterium]